MPPNAAILSLIFAFTLCGCAKKPEPTYLNRPMSEWTRQARDVDMVTRERGFFALSEFDISSGTPETLRILESIAADKHTPDSERGAAIGLADWLSSRAPRSVEIPLLFATIMEHPNWDDAWHRVAHFCVMALYGIHDESDQKQIAETAQRLRDSGMAIDWMKEILKNQADWKAIVAKVEAEHTAKDSGQKP